VSGAAENYVTFGGLCLWPPKISLFSAAYLGRRKPAVIFGGQPLAAENNIGRRKSFTVLLCTFVFS
jgi:hypothetical protein